MPSNPYRSLARRRLQRALSRSLHASCLSFGWWRPGSSTPLICSLKTQKQDSPTPSPSSIFVVVAVVVLAVAVDHPRPRPIAHTRRRRRRRRRQGGAGGRKEGRVGTAVIKAGSPCSVAAPAHTSSSSSSSASSNPPCPPLFFSTYTIAPAPIYVILLALPSFDFCIRLSLLFKPLQQQ